LKLPTQHIFLKPGPLGANLTVPEQLNTSFFFIKYIGNNKECEILFAVNIWNYNGKNMLIHRKYSMNIQYPLQTSRKYTTGWSEISYSSQASPLKKKSSIF